MGSAGHSFRQQVYSTSIQSFLDIVMADTNGTAEFDTLELRNRDVTETLSPLEDLGQDKKPEANGEEKEKETEEEFDKLELRNRTVTETLSPLEDLGQDKEEEAKEEKKDEKPAAKDEPEFDTLHLRNRVVTETLSPLENLGQDPPA